MKQRNFKLLQLYPRLPKDWEIGMVVEQSETGGYKPCDKKYTPNYVQLSDLTEYPTLWQEITLCSCCSSEMPISQKVDCKCVKGEYKVLSLELKGSLVFLDNPTNKYCYLGNPSVGSALENCLKGGWTIHSVRRVSDSEIFVVSNNAKSVGTNKANHIIKGFTVNAGRLWVHWEKDAGGNWLDSIEKVKTPIFTTEDGVDIFEGDLIATLNFKNWTISNNLAKIDSNSNQENARNCDYLWFSSKSAAEEYITMNKPINVSIKELVKELNIMFRFKDSMRRETILTTGLSNDVLRERLVQIVKSKQ